MDPMKNMISEPEEKIYSIGKMVAVMLNCFRKTVPMKKG